MAFHAPGGSGGSGTVTSVSVTTANGVSGSVATSTTTPAISITLGAITPTSVTASGLLASATGLTLEETGAGTDLITIQAPASITAGYTLTLPVDDGTPSQFLQTNGSGVLAWTTVGGGGDMLASTYDPAAIAQQLVGTTATQTLTNKTLTSPVLTAPTLGIATATSLNGLTVTSSTGTLTITNGKTVAVSNTLTFTGTDSSSVAFGAGGTVAYTNVATLSSLVSVGTITTGVWDGTDVAVTAGGTGAATFTDGGVIIGNGTSALQATTAGTSGQVLTSNGAGVDPTFQAASVGITWTEVTTTSQAAAINNGYLANNAALVTVTIPTTAAVGSIVRVGGMGAGGWKVAQNASEQIHFGNQNTTSGTGGSLASTNQYDAVELICSVANTEWVVLSSIGNITVV